MAGALLAFRSAESRFFLRFMQRRIRPTRKIATAAPPTAIPILTPVLRLELPLPLPFDPGSVDEVLPPPLTLAVVFTEAGSAATALMG